MARALVRTACPTSSWAGPAAMSSFTPTAPPGRDQPTLTPDSWSRTTAGPWEVFGGLGRGTRLGFSMDWFLADEGDAVAALKPAAIEQVTAAGNKTERLADWVAEHRRPDEGAKGTFGVGKRGAGRAGGKRCRGCGAGPDRAG